MSTPLRAAPAADQRPGSRRSAADRLRGLLALMTLLTLLLGVPATLIALRGNPLPESLVDLATLTDRLTRPDDGTLFLAALTWVAWLGWSSFALSVLVEIPAHLRGLPSPRLPALGAQQRAASTLVAGATLLFTMPLTALHSPALAATTPHPVAAASPMASPPQLAATSTTTAPVEPARGSVRTVPDAPSTPGPAARYVVQPGDSLWQIATDVLGDGTRYLEIARLNYDQPQPDGLRLTAAHWLRPGWTLTLPPDASARLSADAADTVVVQPGDTLWGIAERTLGDGHRYDEIAAASTGPQADGSRLTDPNRIRAGWQLTVPQTVGAPPPSPADQPAVETAPSAVPTAADEAHISADGHGGDVDTPAASARPAPDPERIEQSSDTTVGEPATEQEDSPAVRTTAGIGALLAAGLLTILGARRARQQRRRKPGQRIPMPVNEVASAESELRVVEDPDAMVRVDQALRTLSALLREAHQVLPLLQLARIEGQQLEVHLAEPADLPAPFVGTTDPRRWVLPADSALLSVEDLAEIPAPYPTLVTLGHNLHGAHLLVNLEHIGTLTLEGDDPSGTAVLAALAAEFGISVWADDLQVTLVGFLPELPGALKTGRVRHVDTLDEVLPTLERRAFERRPDLAELEQQAATSSQAVGPSLDFCAPEILLIAGPLSHSAQRRLEAVVNHLPHAAAVLTRASTPARWTLHLDGVGGLALLSPLDMTVRPQLLNDADLHQLFKLLELADAPSHSTGTSGSLVPDEPAVASLEAHRPAGVAEGRLALQAVPAPAGDERAEPEAAEGDVSPSTTPPGGRTPSPPKFPEPAPVIQLLGPVEIQHARGGVEPSKRRQLTEIAAFLALHPGGDHHGLSEAIWPGARAVDNTRNTALSKLRRWLGTDADGNDFVPRVVEDGYRLHPDVRTDWQLWQELMPDGPAAASTPTLAAALDLVHGKPFAGTNPRRYAWAERDRQDMISAIVDVAHELACRALLDGKAPLARRAAAAGLQADPGAELLWRDALKAEWLAGDLEGLAETADRLTVLTEELGDDLEPETVELLEELLRRPARQARAR